MAKSYCQIFNDAKLAAYFPLDANRTLTDYSASVSTGIASGTSVVTGRVHEALLFSAINGSFFQCQCFPNLRQTYSFTLALWTKPTNVPNGGSIAHLSSEQNGNGTLCFDLLGLTANGTIVAQTVQNSTSITAIAGPVLMSNTWTHLALVYSRTNGMRLFVNGTLENAFPAEINSLLFWYSTWQRLYITLGNSKPAGAQTPTCQSAGLSIIPGEYSGTIDEFYFYTTELDGQDVCVLADP